MQAVIIAAGESSRFWPLSNGRHKCQIKICGRSLIYWTIKSIVDQGIRDIVIVTRPDAVLREELSPAAAELGVKLSFVSQEKPLGTGQAVSLAEKYIKEPFFVFWPYKIIAGQLIRSALDLLEETKSEVVLAGSYTTTPWDFGIFRMEGDRIAEIVENPAKGQEPSRVKILGAYFLQPDFFTYYHRLPNHHPEDFVDALNLYIKDKKTGLLLRDEDVPVLKYPWQFLDLARIKLNSMPEYISPTAKIGENVAISGKVFIEDKAVIGAGTIIEGPCYIGSNCQVGFNNVFRGPVNLEKDVKTGAFTELKNCVIQEGTHLHSGYVGDSAIGRNCRFGAGFIAGNRRIDRQNIMSQVKGEKIDTGLTSLGAMTGDEVKFGIQSGTMPGVLIGSSAMVGPGTLVFENLKDGSKLSTRFEQKKE